MALRPWHLLSLCDGYGGTELALRSVAPVRTVARVERDAYAAAVLVERMGEARLDPCPVWDDVATFDGEPWRGRVDIVAAGFPCPDFSSAGKRAGVDGEHWLWPECFEVIRQVGPRYVLLENVPGLVRLGGLTRVLSDLALIGFDAEWGLLSAAAVGAPHERERWWLVAVTNREGRQPARVSSVGRSTGVGSAGSGESVADATSKRRGKRCHCVLVGGLATDAETSGTDDVGYAQRSRLQGVAGTSIRSRLTPEAGWPPSRDDLDGWADWIAAGGPQPVLRRLTDGPPVGLADALHLGGNGLVPQCAAHAWSQLLDRGGWLT